MAFLNKIQLAEVTLLILVKPEIRLLVLTAFILVQSEPLPSVVCKKGLNPQIAACGYVFYYVRPCLDMLVWSLQNLYTSLFHLTVFMTLSLQLKNDMLQLAVMFLSLHQFSRKHCHTSLHTFHLYLHL